ncbi:ABC transporter permease [Nocardia gipuzkoensis]
MTLQLDPTTSASPSPPAEATAESPAPFTRRLFGLARASSGLILAVIIWQLGARSWLGTTTPAPTEVLEAGWELIRSGELWQHLAASGRRVAVGPAIGIGIGLVCGVAAGLFRIAEDLVNGPLQASRRCRRRR